MNIAVYYPYWTGERVFSGKDILTAFSPLLNFQTDCLAEHSLPLWNPFLNFGYPFVEHYSNSFMFPTHLIMGLFTGSNLLLIQREILLWIILGGIGIYLCIREFGHSVISGVIGAAAFMFSGQIMALPHWHVLVYNAACFPFFILGYHRAAGKSAVFSPLTIFFVTIAILGGHITTTVMGLYFFGLYVIVESFFRRRVIFGLKFLLVVYCVSALLALPKLAPLYAAMELGPRIKTFSAETSKDPFNIINMYNFMSFLLPVKFFFSLYVGLPGILALLSGALRRKLQVNALAVVFALSAWFLMSDDGGSASVLRSAANFLPLMRLVRNEWLMWFYPSIFLVLFTAGYIDDLLSRSSPRQLWITAVLIVAALMLCYFIAYDLEIYRWAFLTQMAIAVAWVIISALRSRRAIQVVLISVLLVAEFSLVSLRVNVDMPPHREGDIVVYSVIDQGSVPRSYREDNRVHSGFYAEALQDHLRPPISESRNRPVLISGFGMAGTYNAYPEQFAGFIDSMNLKRFAGWWYNGQERFDFIKLKDSPLINELNNQPLFFLTSSGMGPPMQESVSFDAITCSKFTFTTQATAPGLFVLRQMYDERWHAAVDGMNSPIEEVDRFFMGVRVPYGSHRVTFTFRDPVFMFSLYLSMATLAGIIAYSVHARIRMPAGVRS